MNKIKQISNILYAICIHITRFYVFTYLGQHCPTETYVTMQMFSVLSSIVATRWLDTWSVASVTKWADPKFYLPLVNLSLNSHMWLVTTVIDSASTGIYLWFGRLVFLISANFTNDWILKI